MHLCFNVRERYNVGGGIRSIYIKSRVSSVFQSALTSPLISNKYIVQTIINSLSVFKDFGQHSRWISPDNIDYYKSRRMVSISKWSSGSPIHFQFQSAITGSTLTSHEVPHADCYITASGRDRQRAGKNTVGCHRTLGPAQSPMTWCWFPLQEYFCVIALNLLFLSIHNVWYFIYRAGRLSSMMIPKFISTWKSTDSF